MCLIREGKQEPCKAILSECIIVPTRQRTLDSHNRAVVQFIGLDELCVCDVNGGKA